MLAWLKGLPIGHYIIMAAIGAAVWVYGDLQLTKTALANERELREQWQGIAETLKAIDVRDTIIIQASEDADAAILEAPNAEVLVPSDVASAWAAGIDSVRNAGANDAPKHDVPRLGTDATKRGRLDSGTASKVL